MSGQEVAKRTPQQELVSVIRGDDFGKQIAAALPGNVTPERFQRVTVTAINQNPDLVAVDRSTLFSAVIRCAQDGLLPDGREAALVVFNDRKAAGGKRATYLPMIGGYRKIAAKHGLSLEAFVVHEADEFDYELGYEPVLKHKPAKLGTDRGEALGAYAVARHVDGRKWLDVMGYDEIEKVRAVSRAATSEYGPWVNHWTEMARKTVARRLFKQLPLDDLDQTDANVIEAGDADADLPPLHRPTMTVDEANVAAALGSARPPHTDPPEDRAPEAAPVEEQADEADWSEAVPVDEEEQTSFADRIPESAREQS
jgi:phage RecT family recombinase